MNVHNIYTGEFWRFIAAFVCDQTKCVSPKVCPHSKSFLIYFVCLKNRFFAYILHVGMRTTYYIYSLCTFILLLSPELTICLLSPEMTHACLFRFAIIIKTALWTITGEIILIRLRVTLIIKDQEFH